MKVGPLARLVLAFGIALAGGPPVMAEPATQQATPTSLTEPPNPASSEDSDPDKTKLDSRETPAPELDLLLEWSENPGVFEDDLHRRHGNLLYLESRREIGEAELAEAKRHDAEQMWDVLENYIGLAHDKNRMARYELASEMGEALLRIDEGTWAALRVGGEAYALAAAIQNMRHSLLEAWQAAADGDPGVKALLDAEARIPPVETESSSIRFLALLQAGDNADGGPIRRYEFGTALISQSPEDIRQVYEALRGDLKKTLEEQLVRVLEDIGREQIEFEGKAEKVALVAALLDRQPEEFGFR